MTFIKRNQALLDTSVKGSHYQPSKLTRSSLRLHRYTDTGNNQLIIKACISNDLKLLLSCLGGSKSKVVPFIRTTNGLTPLTIACRNSSDLIVSWICSNDPQAIKSKDTRGDTALHHAAAGGCYKCVNALLTHGAIASSTNYEGVTPLHMAAYHGRTEIISCILAHDSSVVNIVDSLNKSPLMLAAFKGRIPTVFILLKHNADVNLQDKVGWTALMFAASTGRVAVCRELLENGANKFLVDYKLGKSASDLAHDAGYYEVVDVIENRQVLSRSPSLPEGITMPKLSPGSNTTANSFQYLYNSPDKFGINSDFNAGASTTQSYQNLPDLKSRKYAPTGNSPRVPNASQPAIYQPSRVFGAPSAPPTPLGYRSLTVLNQNSPRQPMSPSIPRIPSSRIDSVSEAINTEQEIVRSTANISNYDLYASSAHDMVAMTNSGSKLNVNMHKPYIKHKAIGKLKRTSLAGRHQYKTTNIFKSKGSGRKAPNDFLTTIPENQTPLSHKISAKGKERAKEFQIPSRFPNTHTVPQLPNSTYQSANSSRGHKQNKIEKQKQYKQARLSTRLRGVLELKKEYHIKDIGPINKYKQMERAGKTTNKQDDAERAPTRRDHYDRYDLHNQQQSKYSATKPNQSQNLVPRKNAGKYMNKFTAQEDLPPIPLSHAASSISADVGTITPMPQRPNAYHKPSPLYTPIATNQTPYTASSRKLEVGHRKSIWKWALNRYPNKGKPSNGSIVDKIKDTISEVSLKYLDNRSTPSSKHTPVRMKGLKKERRAGMYMTQLRKRQLVSDLEVGNASATENTKNVPDSADNKLTISRGPYKKYYDSAWVWPYWKWFSRIVTFWAPNIILRWTLNRGAPDRIQAWREKVALCFLIVLITVFTGFITFGISIMACHPVEQMSLKDIAQNHNMHSKEKYTIVRGRIFDLTGEFNEADKGRDHNKSHFGLPLRLLGHDSSGMFAPFSEEAEGCNKWPPGKSSSNCYGVFGELDHCISSKVHLDRFKKMRTNKWAVYQWSDVVQEDNPESLFVYNEYVFSLKPYFATINSTGVEYYGDITDTLQRLVGTDATIAVSKDKELQALVPCWHSQLRMGRIEGTTIGCFITTSILAIVTSTLCLIILVKLVCAVLFDWAFSLQLNKMNKYFSKKHHRVPHVIVAVTCYNEDEETIRNTLDSIAHSNYSCKRKLLIVVSDGNVVTSDGTRTMPELLQSLIEVHSLQIPAKPLPYISIGDGPKRFNSAQVIPGTYFSTNGSVIPCILINKVGTKRERSAFSAKSGNRGKRDSQLIVMQWLNRVVLNNNLTPLEFELCCHASKLAQLNPDQFEYLMMVDADTCIDAECLPRMVAAMERDQGIMGLCGETKITNKRESWVTRIQVYEYYISHHLSKAFESLWGSVTCLPGCCSMYRIFSRKDQEGGPVVPLIIAPEVIDAYSSNETTTLHQKNLLLLGEDRYLTTVLLRAFPKRKLIYVPRAICRTTVPKKFTVLLSQRRRWINSTIHNLLELILVRDLCGTFCCSMQFLVLMDLLGNVVLPSSVIFLYYLIVAQCMSRQVFLPLVLLAMSFVLQAGMILVTTQKIVYIYWMMIYILAIPLWNLVIPLYAYWRFDDFTWGKTRVNGADEDNSEFITDDERLALNPIIPQKRWREWVKDILAQSSQEEGELF